MKKPQSDRLLKSFIKENFPPFSELVKIGFFTKEMRGDYKAQAERICKFFGYKTVYEYGSKSVTCHLTYASGLDPAGLDSSRPLSVDQDGKLRVEPFLTDIRSIYE